jgi:hypothetical protein
VLLAIAASGYAQTADELISKNLAARGRADKLRKIQTMAMSGTISFSGSASRISVKVRRPNQIREEFTIDGAAIVRAFNGASGWESKDGKCAT